MDETDLRPAIALLLADAFRFTETPTEEGRTAFLDGIGLLWQTEPPTLADERDLFSRLLETGWQVTANFDAEHWDKWVVARAMANL